MVESKDIDIVLGFVSVPYRGATFLNEAGNIQLLCTDKFPSPIGELHFSIIFIYTFTKCSSPIGDGNGFAGFRKRVNKNN